MDADALAAEARDGATRLWRRLDDIDVHPFERLEVPAWRT
jgi:hypothetical protein